jgi:hypothetical protein
MKDATHASAWLLTGIDPENDDDETFIGKISKKVFISGSNIVTHFPLSSFSINQLL